MCEDRCPCPLICERSCRSTDVIDIFIGGWIDCLLAGYAHMLCHRRDFEEMRMNVQLL